MNSPNLYFITFEIIVFSLAIFAGRHAWRRSPAVLWQLVAGMLFGVLLEWATIQQLEAYEYGRFLIMIGGVPIVIGVSWGLIIYSARLFSDATTLPEWARPIMDALLALNIDLAMDAVAIRLGMWDWGQGLQFEYFGVPWANFWAWFWVIFSFSAAIRLLTRPQNWFGRWLAPFLAIIVGTLGVMGTNALIVFVLLPAGWYVPSVVIVLVGALLLLLMLRPKLNIAAPTSSTGIGRTRGQAVSNLTFIIPAAFHLYFLVAGLISGVIFEPPFLLFVSVLMGAVALLLHNIHITVKKTPK